MPIDLATCINIASAIGSLGAAIAGLYAVKIAISTMTRQQDAEKWTANYNFFDKATDLIQTAPELLSFHGIDPKDLSSDGISITDFLYVLYQLAAADAYYRIHDGQQVLLTQYRQNFLRDQKVRLIWKKYLKGKFFNPNSFALAVDKFIEEI